MSNTNKNAFIKQLFTTKMERAVTLVTQFKADNFKVLSEGTLFKVWFDAKKDEWVIDA